jgi:hypothetical protein
MSNTNAQAQTEQNTPAGEIKFNGAPSENMFFNSGKSVYPDLLILGAFISTKTTKFNKEQAWDEYATDADGLIYLERKSNEIIGILADTLASLSVVLVNVDREEVGEEHVDNCGWLQIGLSEILSDMIRENRDLRHSQRTLSEQAERKPVDSAIAGGVK